MPTYDFICEDCDNIFEVSIAIKDYDRFKKQSCPQCDNIENVTGVDMYPMVSKEGKIFYIAEKYNDIGKIKIISENISTMGMYSIDNIIDAIQKD